MAAKIGSGRSGRIAKLAKAGLREEIALPQGVTASLSQGVLKLNGPKGEASRPVSGQNAVVAVENSTVAVSTSKGSKREKKVVGSLRAHIYNMAKGVTEGHTYKLKMCFTHFPITVTVSGNQLLVKNFLGEKTPRKLTLAKGVSVKVEGSELIVESADKDIAGQTAASIEQLTRRANYDKRVFGDGIYITAKGSKEMK